MSNLKPIDKSNEWPLEDFQRVRWLGSDGGWKSGCVLASDGNMFCVLNEHTRTVSKMAFDELETDNPKDDAGNPK